MARKKAAKPRKAATTLTPTKKTPKKSAASSSAASTTSRHTRASAAVEIKLSHDAIAQRAYEIWIEEGQPHGRDRIHWERARDELLQH
jgi:hypothetical protein